MFDPLPELQYNETYTRRLEELERIGHMPIIQLRGLQLQIEANIQAAEYHDNMLKAIDGLRQD